MPIIPHITDDESNLDSIFAMAAKCKIDYVLPGTLYLRGTTRKHFFNLIENEFPEKTEKIKALYKTGGADKDYKSYYF